MKSCRRLHRLPLLLAFCAGVLACTGAPVREPLPSADFLPRQQADVIRVLNWNVQRDSIFASGVRHDSFRRIIRAVSPDIICLQEIMPLDSVNRVSALMRRTMPDQEWYVHAVADNVVTSRFPLLSRDGEEVVPYPFPQFGFDNFSYGYAMVLVDIPDRLSDRDLYLIAVHNKSRSGPDNIAMRQRQSDAIARSLRERRRHDRAGSLEYGTPIVIAGDLNVLENDRPADTLQHLTTLLTGDIVDEQTFGPDSPPDWDDSALSDVLPRHNGRGEEVYTWRADQAPFPPGALDRVLYTDSVLTVQHSFVLNTTTMSGDELARAGLQAADVLYDITTGYFDHLPMVVDFGFPPTEK